MIKVGKVGKANQKANRMLKLIFMQLGVTTCELRFLDCQRNMFLGFAHRHKRVWYRSCPEKLYEIKQVILACQSCHDKMEYDKKLTDATFERLRGSEV